MTFGLYWDKRGVYFKTYESEYLDYESLIRSRITQPLGMPDTGITLSPSMRLRLATGHNALLAPVAQKDWDPFHAFASAGALRSSAQRLTGEAANELHRFRRISPLKDRMRAEKSVLAGENELRIAV